MDANAILLMEHSCDDREHHCHHAGHPPLRDAKQGMVINCAAYQGGCRVAESISIRRARLTPIDANTDLSSGV
jgi:hypothetical protein